MVIYITRNRRNPGTYAVLRICVESYRLMKKGSQILMPNFML